VIAVFTVVFLEIHPFQDGNGRLSRVLTTLLLLRAGYAYVPYSSLESVIERSKEGYYLALSQTQRTIRSEEPDRQPWVLFFLRALQQQKGRLEARIERERIMLERLPDLSLRILDLARDHDTISNSMVVRATGANRNTVKKHLQELVEGGKLVMIGKAKGSRYRVAG
jgi:Fic family protein